MDEDETSHVWTFLREARDSPLIESGAIVVAGNEDAPAVAGEPRGPSRPAWRGAHRVSRSVRSAWSGGGRRELTPAQPGSDPVQATGAARSWARWWHLRCRPGNSLGTLQAIFRQSLGWHGSLRRMTCEAPSAAARLSGTDTSEEVAAHAHPRSVVDDVSLTSRCRYVEAPSREDASLPSVGLSSKVRSEREGCAGVAQPHPQYPGGIVVQVHGASDREAATWALAKATADINRSGRSVHVPRGQVSTSDFVGTTRTADEG